MKKTLAFFLAALLIAAMFVSPAYATSDEEYEAWALEHGYVKMDADLGTSATDAKQGGVNFGAIDWSRELQVAAVREWLKGGKYLGSPDFAQDETGYNYREMYQMATCANNIPSNTNLELVLDADSLHLIGVSEAGTGKTLQFAANPYVSVSWCKQLRVEEEEVYNYFCSYGITFNGKVKIYTTADLETEEGQNALLNIFDKYYPTLNTTWPAYSGTFAGLTDEAAIREAKLGYISNVVTAGSSIVYEILPSKIVITAPFMINMPPQMMNAQRFTTVQEGEQKYAYTLGITDTFLDMAIAYKNECLQDEATKKTVEDYYATGMFPMLDQYCAQMQIPTALEAAMTNNSCAGLKTQTTWTPEA